MEKTRLLAALLGCILSAFPLVADDASPSTTAAPAGDNPTLIPVHRTDQEKLMQSKAARFGHKHYDIVFDGDSITNRWENAGKEVWDKRYAANSADFGIGGDRVEHLLWRLQHGQVDGIDPKVVVLLIGTNNLGANQKPDQVAEGIKALSTEYEKHCPNAHLIVMGIFPRGNSPTDPFRAKITAVNAKIASLDDGDRVTFVDIGRKLLEPDGSISKDMMPDGTHPLAKGFEIWSDAIQPIIDKYVPPVSPQ